jgi:DNA (cytosine-5)-methyltransferase 1
LPKHADYTTSDYVKWLSKAFGEADTLVKSDDIDDAIKLFIIKAGNSLQHSLKTINLGEEVLLGKTVSESIEIIINNLKSNKYLFSILLTCLIEKLVHPDQDIRYAKAELNKGYSNRTTDESYVTPFLKEHCLTSCAASGTESGRNFERPYPYTLDYVGNPRGAGNKEAFLGIIHAIQVEKVDPFPIIVLLMALDLRGKKKVVFDYPEPKGLTIQNIFDAVDKHYREAQGNGRARLPVMAIQAIYLSIIPQMSRYKDMRVRNPANRHTGNDKEGWIGDVQVDRADGTPFEAVEVKAGRQITSDMVSALLNKFRGQAVDRYYILSTNEEYIAPNERDRVYSIVDQLRQETGCQVIVNGLKRSLWYYLRLIEDANIFVADYTEQLKNDLDVKDEHRQLWFQILNSLSNIPDKTSNQSG